MGEEEWGATVAGNGVAVMEGGWGKLTNVVLHERLGIYTKVQVYHSTMLST